MVTKAVVGAVASAMCLWDFVFKTFIQLAQVKRIKYGNSFQKLLIKLAFFVSFYRCRFPEASILMTFSKCNKIASIRCESSVFLWGIYLKHPLMTALRGRVSFQSRRRP